MIPSDRLAGGRPTPQPSDGGTRQVPDPAAGTAPVSRRAARASVPGGAGSAPRKADPAGKTPRRAVSQDSLPDGDPGPETRRPGRASVRAGGQTPSPLPISPPRAAAKGAAGAARDADRHQRPAGPVAMSPAGTAPASPREADSAAPAGSTDEDRAEQRAAWKRAESAQHAEARRRGQAYIPRARRGVQAASGPGMVRRMPPPLPPDGAA